MSLASSLNGSLGSPSPLISDEMADRIFDTISSDSGSQHSGGTVHALPCHTEEGCDTPACQSSCSDIAPPLTGSSVAPPSNTPSTASVPMGDRGGQQPTSGSRRKKVLTSSRRRQSKPHTIVPLTSIDISVSPGGAGAEEEEGGENLEGLDSVLSTPDSASAETRMELGQDGTGSPEPDMVSPRKRAVRTASAGDTGGRLVSGGKKRVSGAYSLPLVIEEPVREGEEEVDTGLMSPPRGREAQLRRSPSPSLQIPPSPSHVPASNSSPRSYRRTRIAHTRRKGSRGQWARKIYLHVHVHGSSFFLGKVTALGVLCCFALLFV